jgi:hypothetical protein
MSKQASIRGREVDFVEEFQMQAEQMARQCMDAKLSMSQLQEFMQFARGAFRVPHQNLDFVKRKASHSSSRDAERWRAVAPDMLRALEDIKVWGAAKGEDIFAQAKCQAAFVAMVRHYINFVSMGDFPMCYRYE